MYEGRYVQRTNKTGRTVAWPLRCGSPGGQVAGAIASLSGSPLMCAWVHELDIGEEENMNFLYFIVRGRGNGRAEAEW